MNETLIFFKIVSLPLKTLIPASFSLFKAPLKLLSVCSETVALYFFAFPLRPTIAINFQFRKEEKVTNTLAWIIWKVLPFHNLFL